MPIILFLDGGKHQHSEDQEVASSTQKCGINEGLLVRNGLRPFFKREPFLEGKGHHV